MIEITKGNIIKNDSEAIVNTVNCVGFMGKGIALQYKQAFPDNFKAYEKACRAEKVKPGLMFIFETNAMFNPKYIVNFPTKRHWRGNSRLEDVENGLRSLVEDIKRLEIKSIAIPPLGCGLGGLDWNVVKPMILDAFSSLPEVTVSVFEPKGAPDAKTMPVRTALPDMTPARALFIKLIEQYQLLSYRLTLLEIQKLAYFLQEAGEPLRLKYVAHIYGPYADNLKHVLERIEGHFTRGYGDTQKPDVEIELIPSAIEKADRFLKGKDKSIKRLEKVSQLIDGFETPYGMELLSSTHWVAKNGPTPATTSSDAVEAIHTWNRRKRNMLQTDHIIVAWNQLKEQGWI